MCGGRTVPPVEESLPPTARPLPTSRQLPRTIFSPPQQCSTPGSSVPTCPRRRLWSIRETPTTPQSRTVPEGAANPQPSARPLPTSRQSPRTIFSPPKKCSSAGSSVPTCPRRQFWSIGEPSTMPRSRTVPDAAEEPQPSRRQPQIRLRHDEPPRQWSMQWHTVRAALQPGPDPLALRQGRGQAPAQPRPSLALRRVGLRANHENLHSQWRLIPHLVDLDSLDPQLRLTHLGAEASLDPRILPPLAGTRETGGDERDRSHRSPRDPSSHPLTPSPHRRARRRPRSRRRGRRWDPYRSPAQHPLGGCTRPERDLLLPSPISDTIHKLLLDVFPSGDARRRRRPPRRRAGPSSRRQSSVRGWRKRSTSLHTQATAAFHFFAREGGGSFPLLCTRKRR